MAEPIFFVILVDLCTSPQFHTPAFAGVTSIVISLAVIPAQA